MLDNQFCTCPLRIFLWHHIQVLYTHRSRKYYWVFFIPCIIDVICNLILTLTVLMMFVCWYTDFCHVDILLLTFISRISEIEHFFRSLLVFWICSYVNCLFIPFVPSYFLSILQLEAIRKTNNLMHSSLYIIHINPLPFFTLYSNLAFDFRYFYSCAINTFLVSVFFLA